MTKGERRQPHAFYTSVLRRICERLDSQDTHEIRWKDRYFPEESLRSVMRAESLWVAGSYARGAPTCGDLDLVLKVEPLEGYPAPLSRFISKAFRRSPGVRCYSGTPEENSSGVTFPEAIHIWSRGMDWANAIASIPVHPLATRFNREIDDIPLRAEQLYCEVSDLEDVLRRRRAQEIDWRFLPVEPGNSDPLPDPNEDELRVLRLGQFLGKRTRRLLPHVLHYVREQRGPIYSRHSIQSGTTELELEGTFIGMGRPRIRHTLLDTVTASRVALMPHFSRRGPNGIWELRRGPRHPLELRIRNIGAFVLRTKDGLLGRDCFVTRLGSECELIALYPTRESAERGADEQREMGLPDLTPTWIEGTALLDALSYADATDIHMKNGQVEVLCLTHMGGVVLGEDDHSVRIAEADRVLDVLAEAYG